ncbi:MAG TPA: hypothetical protein VMF52_12570 [Steroidobacteraceae bacterium]|nr:hypothetical protein [Steroidobacteraceae bacterium]
MTPARPSPSVYHGDAHEDGRYYHAFSDTFQPAANFFTTSRHTLAEHFDRYGWRAEDARRSPMPFGRKNLFVQTLFRDGEPSKRELNRVAAVTMALQGIGVCASCTTTLHDRAAVFCERCAR